MPTRIATTRPALREEEIRTLRSEFAGAAHQLRVELAEATAERDRLRAKNAVLELEVRHASQALESFVALTMVRSGKLK